MIFEGEYLNGKRWKGKEYNCYSYELDFEGEYLNGKKWNGKGYEEDNYENDIIYELKNGNGKGKEYKDNEIIFEGEYLSE